MVLLYQVVKTHTQWTRVHDGAVAAFLGPETRERESKREDPALVLRRPGDHEY